MNRSTTHFNFQSSYPKIEDLYRPPLTMTIKQGVFGELEPVGQEVLGASSDPVIFGPSNWFTLHNTANHYPNHPTDFVKNGTKQLLSNWPFTLPCLSCREHFYSFLNAKNLNDIVKSRDAFFQFTVDAHNYVNLRTGKRAFTLDDAKRAYGFDDAGKRTTIKISYI